MITTKTHKKGETEKERVRREVIAELDRLEDEDFEAFVEGERRDAQMELLRLWLQNGFPAVRFPTKGIVS